MSTNQFLSERIREVYLQGTWIANTNYKELLQDVKVEMANRKFSDLNTIALITFHINYYLKGLINVFKKGRLEISDKFSFDMPPIKTEQEWQMMVGNLLDNADELAQLVGEMPYELFDEDFVDARYGTWLKNMEGAIEHSYYHLGQIALLKKLIMAEKVVI